MPSAARELTPPEVALMRAVDLGVLAVTGAGTLATVVGAAATGPGVAAGIAAASVLTVAFVWVTRLAMRLASAGPAEAIGTWVLVSYAAKFVLILVGLTLAGRDHQLDRTAFGLTLVAGIVVSVALQALLWRPGGTGTVQPVAELGDDAHDDDRAVAAARAAAGPPSVKVPRR